MNITLDSLTASYREITLPELPGSFASDVLRAIRLRQSASAPDGTWWQDFLNTFLRPSRLAAALTIAVTVGAAVPYVTQPREAMLAASGLDLAVFASGSQLLPSGRLDRIPSN